MGIHNKLGQKIKGDKVPFESIKNGIKDLKEDKIDVLVTPPINKEAIHSDDFQFILNGKCRN